MSKADIIEEILLAATRLFSRQGYDNTSLRQIARHADVGLGTINLYFRTKENLFLDVISLVIKELSRERLALLAAARREGLNIERVLEAAISPIAVRVTSADPTERGKPYLVRWAMQGPPSVERHARELHDAISKEFVEAIMQAMPGLDRRDAVSGFAVLISAAYSRHLLDQRYDHLVGRPALSDRQDWTRQSVRSVVKIVAAGLRSLDVRQMPSTAGSFVAAPRAY